MQWMIIAAALLLAPAASIAAGQAVATNGGADSVNDMLQRKEARQLRGKLVAAGRVDEVRLMDQALAMQLHENRVNRMTRVNQALDRASTGHVVHDVPMLNNCGREELRL
jgi:hypothetical protein